VVPQVVEPGRGVSVQVAVPLHVLVMHVVDVQVTEVPLHVLFMQEVDVQVIAEPWQTPPPHTSL
jgi:hypothetical protein